MSTEKLIYIIEDDENIRELVRVALSSFGYQVKAFETAEQGLDAIRIEIPSLVVFDLMLPFMDGISAIKILRANPKTQDLPIILLTAKDSELDKVTGLDAGADDYLTKPFGILELTARVRSLLRRTSNQQSDSENIITVNGITINPETREVFMGQELIELTLKEYELLKILVENPDKVVSRDELLNLVWGYNYVGETRTLDMHIRTLRQKLKDDAEHPKYIKTVRGVGYRFKPN
ncbi:MAG: hypothetical protein K0R90_468 [Oscillospiraceae bacterium]|jgi:two-component system alkaline phosphatase synthesis response regulator PhoP|nr:hypothetical protein [Oscillospiraceae bacterium]